jgi:hypothetical protein
MEHSLLQTVSVSTRWRINVALCNTMSSEAKPEFTAVSISTACGVPQPPIVSRSVADRIAAFIDGRTDGEDLLHELYDYVLEEPIPQRMRALLKEK